MNINIDLLKNWKGLVKKSIEYYMSIGFKFHNYENKSEDEIIYTYMQFQNRLVQRKPRMIKYSKKFSCPSTLKIGLEELERKIKRGEKILPHLSRKIDNFNFNDGMLSEWRIQHFHLGTKPDNKRKYLNVGTKDILYAVHDENYVFFLIIDEHNFTSKRIFQIIEENFPHILELSKSSYSSGSNTDLDFSETERRALRKAGFNALTISNGNLYFPPGGGITSDGRRSLKAFRAIDNIITILNSAERIIKQEFDKYYLNVFPSKYNSAEFNFVMETIEKDKITVVDSNNIYVIKLNFRDDLKGFHDIIIEEY